MEKEKMYSILTEKIGKECVSIDEPMNTHTSFKVGGLADLFVRIPDMEELKEVLRLANKESVPIYVIGSGSNLLVKDGGIRGIVLQLNFRNIDIDRDTKDGTIYVTVGSGMPLGFLAQKLVKEGLGGFEFASGIPGSIGGAIRMNAGAHGGEMKDIVVSTTYMDLNGNIYMIGNEEHEFSYRNSIFSKEQYVILTTTLRLQKADPKEIKAKMEEYATWRKEKQPLEYPSAGSTFKRGEGYITAALIDACGLKGYRVGDAMVSTKHAGFVVNVGKATAKEILEVVEHVKKVVKEQEGKEIQLEMQVIGEE